MYKIHLTIALGSLSMETVMAFTGSSMMANWLASRPDTSKVAQFTAGPGIHKLTLQFDSEALKEALQQVLAQQAIQLIVIFWPRKAVQQGRAFGALES